MSKGAFNQTRTWARAKNLAEGVLSCVGRSTISGWLVSSGQQFKDWSAAYRLFKGNRIDTDELFSVVRRQVVSSIDPEESSIYAHMDDTLLRKTGKKVSGAKWLRDPLGPPFQTNLVWGQRFIQISLSLFEKMGAVPCKTIPVDLSHSPLPPKPGKRGTANQWEEYKECQKKMKMSVVGAQKIAKLRTSLDEDGHKNKTLVVSVDGSYTNQTVLKTLPYNVTIIGRIRKDCKLNALPGEDCASTGRKRIYGEALPTPEEIRMSEEHSWQTVLAHANGKVHSFSVKSLAAVRWKKSGEKNLRLVIIRAVGYRLRQNSDILYREPVYLICTNPNMPIEKLVQAYLWRWGIEVNFREQKTLMGCGQAQVRKEDACEKVPAFHASIYSMLLLAANKTQYEKLPRPKWYKKQSPTTNTTGDIINAYRANCWAQSMKLSFDHFVKMHSKQRSTQNVINPNLSAILYARY